MDDADLNILALGMDLTGSRLIVEEVSLRISRFCLFVFFRKSLYTSSSRASRGRKFQKKKELYSKERICL